MKRIIQILVGLAVYAMALPSALLAEDRKPSYPNKPISYIIPFGAGGESGIAARLQQPFFKSLTGQDLVISYRPGGGGAVMWDEINNLPGDGHSIVGINLPHIVLQPMLGAKYKTRDITGIFLFHYTPDAVVVHEDSPFETLDDLIEFARENPGQIMFSGSGRGSANHLAQIRFDKLAGIQTKYRPYKGTAASIAALVQGKVNASWGYTTVGTTYPDDVRLLAVATKERHPRFPDVPTFKEKGFEIIDGAYRGIAVPKSTPKKTRLALSKLFEQINKDPAMRQEMEDRGFAPVDIPYPKVAEFIKARTVEYLTHAKQVGLGTKK